MVAQYVLTEAVRNRAAGSGCATHAYRRPRAKIDIL